VSRLPVPRLRVEDAPVLEARAAALAAGSVDEARAEGLLRVVAFTLASRPCAVEADRIERAVGRLAAPLAVPLADGGERTVAFVEERPLPVADLAGHAAGRPRHGAELAGLPAVVVASAEGPVAVVVDGPLDLLEDRVTAVATEEGGTVRVAGRLAGGASLVDGGWLAAWAGSACRP
jgi:hypothetical protein